VKADFRSDRGCSKPRLSNPPVVAVQRFVRLQSIVGFLCDIEDVCSRSRCLARRLVLEQGCVGTARAGHSVLTSTQTGLGEDERPTMRRLPSGSRRAAASSCGGSSTAFLRVPSPQGQEPRGAEKAVEPVVAEVYIQAVTVSLDSRIGWTAFPTERRQSQQKIGGSLTPPRSCGAAQRLRLALAPGSTEGSRRTDTPISGTSTAADGVVCHETFFRRCR